MVGADGLVISGKCGNPKALPRPRRDTKSPGVTAPGCFLFWDTNEYLPCDHIIARPRRPYQVFLLCPKTAIACGFISSAAFRGGFLSCVDHGLSPFFGSRFFCWRSSCRMLLSGVGRFSGMVPPSLPMVSRTSRPKVYPMSRTN